MSKGYAFIDKLSFDAYNESEHEEFIEVIEKHKERYGFYSERKLADKIYRTQTNRRCCKEHGLCMSGSRLGRRGAYYKEELKEIGQRNAVEGKFGNGKRKLGLGLIMAKLQETIRAEE